MHSALLPYMLMPKRGPPVPGVCVRARVRVFVGARNLYRAVHLVCSVPARVPDVFSVSKFVQCQVCLEEHVGTPPVPAVAGAFLCCSDEMAVPVGDSPFKS